MAIKAYPALNAGAQSLNKTSAKSADEGVFTFWRDSRRDLGEQIGTELTNVKASACLVACQSNPDCAAVHMMGVTTDPTKDINSCSLRRGNALPGNWIRTLLRAVSTRLDLSTLDGLASE